MITNAPFLPFYKNVKSFEQYKKEHLSKIYTYEDENKNLTYFYFFRRQKSDYYTKDQIKLLFAEYDQKKEELKKEFKELQIK